MAEISKIRLPSGNEYEIKDAVARSMISGGVSFIVAWDGTSTPTVANIPAGVVVTYNGTTYTGTLSASSAQAGAFYLVKSSTQKGGTLDVYDEYVPIGSGTKTWEKIGDTQLDLSDLGALAYKDTVTLSKGTKTNVLGASTTFTASAPTLTQVTLDVPVAGVNYPIDFVTTTVSPNEKYISATASGTAVSANGTAAAITGFGSHTTKSALGANATFTTSVTPATTNIKATASKPTAVGVSTAAVTSYPGVTQKLNRTSYSVVTGNTNVSIPNVTGNTNVSIPNVTSAGSASTWSFAMGTGTDAETLIISGGNSVAPTLGTALSASKVTLGTALSASKITSESKYVLDGTFTTTSGNTGPDVITGLGTPNTVMVFDADEGISVTAPTVSLSTGATAGAGVISVATGISSATTTANSKDAVTAITALGTPTTANALTGVKVTAQPTITMAANTSTSTGAVKVVTGINGVDFEANVFFETNDCEEALGAGTTVTAPTITVGTNNRVGVAPYDSLSVSTS